MRAIRVHWSNGDTTATNINGTDESIREYYLGNRFNIGDGNGGDLMVTATRVEFLDLFQPMTFGARRFRPQRDFVADTYSQFGPICDTLDECRAECARLNDEINGEAVTK